MEVTFLGTGSSMGIPVIGCHCDVCQSTNPNDKRLRCSILIEVDGRTILVDTSPDLRQQALTHEIENVDGVIITHIHFDHIAGIDDLRVYNYRFSTVIPMLMHEKSYVGFASKYDYLLREGCKETTQTAKLDVQRVDGDHGDVDFLDLPIRYFCYGQAKMHVMGFRLRNFAYVTDIRVYEELIFDELKGLDVLVVSALRHDPSKVHFNIEEAIAFAQKVGAKKTYFTHMAHEIDHVKVNDALPEGIELAYDGLKI